MRCKATTLKGQQCKKSAVEGSSFCTIHAKTKVPKVAKPKVAAKAKASKTKAKAKAKMSKGKAKAKAKAFKDYKIGAFDDEKDSKWDLMSNDDELSYSSYSDSQVYDDLGSGSSEWTPKNVYFERLPKEDLIKMFKNMASWISLERLKEIAGSKITDRKKLEKLALAKVKKMDKAEIVKIVA